MENLRQIKKFVHEQAFAVLRSFHFLRATAIVTTGAFVLWIATGVTLNLAFAESSTVLAREIWPWGTRATVAEAARIVDTLPASEAVADKESAILRAALLREPVSADGLSVLASLNDYRGNAASARTLFNLSERLSRRNTLTQIWLIEDAVRQGRLREAIQHYDRAMRVTDGRLGTLLPVLVEASADKNVLEVLLPFLARRPPWLPGYLNQLGTTGSDPAVMAAVLKVAPPDMGTTIGRSLAENLLRRMIMLNAGRDAVVAANRMEGRSGATRSLQEGDFEKTGNFVPFAWSFKDEADIRAYRDSVPDGSTGLRIESSNGQSGIVAEQFTGLEHGDYTFQGIAGGVSADVTGRPMINLVCGNGKPLAHFVLPLSNDAGVRFRFPFNVPTKDCDVQLVTIVTAPAVDSIIWLDNLAIER
jgi:hypothetical protein|tara:strand:- start:1533 stop:2786 length:1254 start_codon:yes stop_codon:yes gene_type:complete